METAMMVIRTNKQPKRERLLMADGEICEGKRVKRKRRNMMASVIANSQNINQENATTVKRSSKYRGVSRHRWTGRYEAHLWDKLSWNVTQKKKGKQVYLVRLSPSIENSFTKDKQMFTSQYLETEFSWRGKSRTVSKILKSFGCKISNVRQQIAQTLNAGGAYDDEEAAARAYDMAALKYWGVTTLTNFPINDYNKEIEFMQTVTKEEYLASLRRKSSGFSRGVSKYRGVARHHHNGRWEARIGRVFGNKYLYLGTYSTQEEAAKAYDIAAIEYRGINAVTNFDLSTYITWLKPGANTSIPSRDIKLSTQSPVTSSSFTCGQNLKLSYLPTKAFKTIDVSKQETNGRKIPYNSRKESSSPKALDLLFRSSVFRELVRRNSNLLEEEREDESIENSHAIEFQGQHNFSYAQNMIRSNTVGMIPIF